MLKKDSGKKKEGNKKSNPEKADSSLGDPVGKLEFRETFFEKRWVKMTFGGLSAALMIGILLVYWFMPFGATNFTLRQQTNSNFSLNSSIPTNMQFYPNMRYPSSDISYEIDPSLCTLQKQGNIKEALKILENLTVLNFYPVNSNPEISITCDDKVVVNEKYFVAGEGGPVNITQSGDFNVIKHGKVLLLRDSNCQVPNVAIHELLHSLGFDHSKNPNNVMYPVTSCSQTIGQDIPALIDALYAYPSYPDLTVENASAVLHGRYIDANITISNRGLADSTNSVLLMSANGKLLKKTDVNPMPIGSGIMFSFANILAPLSVNQINFTVQTNEPELQKNNNGAELFLKK